MPNKRKLEETTPMPEIVEPSGNGHDGHEEMALQPQRTGPVPMLGQEDLYITGGRPAGFNVPKELLHGSDKAEEYLARTELTEEEIGTYTRVQGLKMAFDYGMVDLDHVFCRKFNALISKNRKSREETVEVAKAEKKFAGRMADRMMGRELGGNRGAQGGIL